jgi:uncharacterized protein YhaN
MNIYKEYINHLKNKNLQELYSLLENLEYQDYINHMSDNFYYTEGRKKLLDNQIKKVKIDIDILETM